MTATTHQDLIEQLRSTIVPQPIADAPPPPAERHPPAGVGPQWARVPTTAGGHVMAGPGTGIPLPPGPPIARPAEPAPVKPAGPSLRERWAALPRKYQWPIAGAGAVLLGLAVLKWVVPWVSPDPDVVLIQTPPEQPAPAAAPATATTPPMVDPLAWGPGEIALSARALIGVGADKAWRNPERAIDVSRQAQTLIRDDGAAACALRLTVPAPGALTVTLDTIDGSVPLFACAVATTTTEAETTLPTAPAVGS